MFNYLEVENYDFLLYVSLLQKDELVEFQEDCKKIAIFREKLLNITFKVGQEKKLIYDKRLINDESGNILVWLDRNGKLILKTSHKFLTEYDDYNLEVDILNKPEGLISWFLNYDITADVEMLVKSF